MFCKKCESFKEAMRKKSEKLEEPRQFICRNGHVILVFDDVNGKRTFVTMVIES